MRGVACDIESVTLCDMLAVKSRTEKPVLDTSGVQTLKVAETPRITATVFDL